MSSFKMAGQGPRARYYAGANSLAIFSAQGSNPLQDCKLHGKGVTKDYDKSVKGYVYNINGGLQSKLQLPKDDSKIDLKTSIVTTLLGAPSFCAPRVSDINNTRRKMYFSTSFSDIKSTPLHCQIPISMVIRNKWLSLAFHVADLFNNYFCTGGGMTFKSIDVIVLGPVCKLRKIFTMRCRIMETYPNGYLEESSEEVSENSLPQEHTYALGVDTCVQILDMASLQSATACNNEANQAHDATEFMDVTQDSRPGPESGLTARKGGAKQNTNRAVENMNKAVHVAFGTRMPLPLSTVHINTNLPHDKCPTLIKDHVGKVHFISDSVAAAAATGGGGGERNKPPSNMISRALGVASLDRERRNMVGDSAESKLMLKTNRMGCSARWRAEEKEQVTNTVHVATTDGDGGCGGSDCVGEPTVGASEDCPLPAPAQVPESPKIGAQQHCVSTNAESQVGGVQSTTTISSSTTNNVTSNKSPSKWASKKRDVQMSTIHLKQQKSKEQRSKEYKHSRYMDSPPGSPPSGWDDITTGGRTLSGDITFHDHFLEGSWMNSQLSESIDAGKPYCLANSLKEKILSSMPHSLSTRLDEEAMTLADAINQRDESTKTIEDQVHQSSSEWANSFHGLTFTSSDRVNKKDTGTDEDHYWEDTEAVSAYGEYYSEGQQSWSSGSTSSVPGHALREFPCFLARGTAGAAAHKKKLGGGAAQSSKSDDDLHSRLMPTSLLATESDKKSLHEDGDGDDSLMFDIHDDRFFPGHPSEKRKDLNGLEAHSTVDSFCSTIQGKGVGESFDFDAEPNTHEELESSLQDTTHQVNTSGDFRREAMDPVRNVMNSDTMLASWHVPDADEQLSFHISSGAAQRLIDQEHEGPIKTNGRPDDDLDLLYDPTLDCYYDPKTNRYYELK